jgi:murein DD-endopeptidase MepM/ murein hydrolase activator NlpD
LPDGCGRPHLGIDIYAHYGTPIVAPEMGHIISYKGEGVFTPAGEESKNGGGGRVIILVGNSGYTYVFMHTMGFSETIAKIAGIQKDFGDTETKSISVPVHAGDIISYVGRTGGVINPHLHFQVMKNDTTIDPKDLL